MRTTLRHIAAAAVTIFGIASCNYSDSDGSTGPQSESKTYVVLSVHTDSIRATTSKQISARVTDQTGLLKLLPVSWKSSDPSVAMVSEGIVTGVAPGTAMVVASAGDGADSALIVVTPDGPMLDVQPSAATVAVGDTIDFIATIRETNGDIVPANGVTWSSSDTVAAKFVKGGTLVARAEGDLSISAEAQSLRGSSSVRVFRPAVASVSISPYFANVYKGAQLAVTLRDQQGRVVNGPVTFGSSDYSRATVTNEGVVTGLAAGSVVITATSGAKTGSATLNVLSAPAASVSLSLPSDTMLVGVELQAVVTALDASGAPVSGRMVGYVSSNLGVASVTPTGIVKGRSAGSADISAIVDNIVATKRITVRGRLATLLSITPGAPSVSVGHQSQLVARVLDQNGSEIPGQSIIWSSANPGIATVSQSGLVTATSGGSTTISAVSGGLSASVVVSVVSTSVARVRVSPSTAALVMGGSPVTLIATAFDANENVLSGRAATWSSLNPAVASVSSSAVLSAIGAGSTTVTASIEGKTASVAVTVSGAPAAPVASVTVTLATATLNVGQQTQATAVLKDAQGNVLSRAITWSSLDTAVAKVSATGVITAYAGGTVAIIAVSEGVSGAASLMVNTPSPTAVASVTLVAPTQNLTIGQSVQSVVTLKDAQGNILTGRTISYSTENSSIVTVQASGVITGVGAGTTNVRATSEGKSATLGITVATTTAVVPVASVTLTASGTSLAIGQTMPVQVTLKDGHGTVLTGRTITWSSSAPTVATVSASGVVTGVAGGSAMISASSEGIIGSLAFTVNAPGGVNTVTVTLSSLTLSVGQTTQATATGTDANGNPVAIGSPTWSSSNASVATVSASGVVTAASAGSATITATVGGNSGAASITVTSSTGTTLQVTPPELPRSVPSPNVPAPTGKTIRVASGQDLQAALNSALPGDVVALASGATFIGNFIIPSKGCTGWVTIRTDVPDSDLPAAGQRITPSYAAKLAKIMTGNNQPALRAAMPTCQWRLFGLEVAVHPSFTGLQYWLMTLGDGGWSGGGEQQTSLGKVPTDIVLDRMYIHGQTSSNLIRCLALNSAQTSVVNSYIDQCHAKGFDSQAIEGWNGPGPYLIENNFVAGAGENIMFGGADPGIAGLSPSDITIRRNHVYKDPSWKGLWTVKNLFELKNARRLLIEGNIFENNWVDAQAGMAIVIKSSHDACSSCTWQGSQDVTFRYNIVKNSPRGFNLQAVDGESDNHVARVRAEHNLFQNIGTFNGTGGDGWLMLLTHDLKDILIQHNTFIGNTPGYGLAAYFTYSGGAAQRIEIVDNTFAGQSYYALASDGGNHGSALTAFAGTSWRFAGNAVSQIDQQFWALYPSGNNYTDRVSSLGLASDGSLSSGSPYKNRATDGADPGANIPEVGRRTAGVIVVP
jgi:uncharacterized protein YjdB